MTARHEASGRVPGSTVAREAANLNRPIRAGRSGFVTRPARWLARCIKHLLRPVRTVAELAGGTARDAVRPRSALLAENALLRQQILDLRRATPYDQ